MPIPAPNHHTPHHRPSHPAAGASCRILARGATVACLKGGALMDMPMSFNLLTQNLTQSFRIVYDDYQALLGKKHYARDLLSLLHRWTDWASGQPESEQVERDGWIRLTAKDLATNLGFSRRNYEQARADLKEMGIVECHRERKVHGKLAWKLNIFRLAELIAKMKGRKLVVSSERKDNYPLPDFIPADLWDEYHAGIKSGRG